MQKIIKQIYSDKIAGLTTTITGILLLLDLIIIALTYRFLPTYLPLYNKRAWGYARLGNTYEIFLPILLMVVCICINTFLGLWIQKRIPLLSRFLFATSLCIGIFTTFFVVKIITQII